MCDVLQIAKSTFYYEAKERAKQEELTEAIVEIFHKNCTRKLKAKLQKQGIMVSRRRIGRIMKEQGLVSTYTIAQYNLHKSASNEAKTANVLARQFSQALRCKRSDVCKGSQRQLALHLCAGQFV